MSNEESQLFHFTCPMIDQAEVVTAVSGEWTSEIKNQVASSLLPEEIEAENEEEINHGFVFVLDSDGYKGTINLEVFEFGVRQFR